MLRNLTALGAGVLFGLGLAVSQMVDPMKVKAFLDVAGAWDPSLILVMASAVAISFVAFRLAARRTHPVFADAFALPTRRDIDARLIGGSAVFGIGWGIAGFCPAPALSSLVYGRTDSLAFVAAMIAGLAVAPLLVRRAQQPVLSATPG